MLLSIDLDEDCVNEEGITLAPVLPLQTPCIFDTEFDTPQPDGFITDGDTSLGQEIFNITIAEIKTVAEPDCVTDDIWRESMAFISTQALM
jgi:hypothetical protein